MSPEMIVAIVAVFVSGGAMGAAGTLLGQWVLRKMQPPEPQRRLDHADVDLLRSDVADLTKKLHGIDARLDFTEQLLGGALPLSRPPELLEDGDEAEDHGEDRTKEETEESSGEVEP